MKPKVSIIIPVFNQYQLLKEAVESIKEITNKRVSYELILVDDASPEPETQEYLKLFPTETLHLPENKGFINACREGAKRAVGEYLLFLNSDTRVISPNWLKEMISWFQEYPDIGVVGAKLLLANDTIQHAGMSYYQDKMNFMHDFYGADRYDPRVTKSHETGMVTGACLMTPRKLWEEIGGFDPDLKGGTFEDTFYCLQAKEKGYRIWYCAEAELYHYQSQSMPQTGFTMQSWFEHNWELFKQRYVRTGKFGPYPKICACIIAFNEEDFIQECITSIYDFVHKIIVVEGSTESTREFANEEGFSSDRTNQLLESYPDRDEKIQVIHGKWKDKTEMRNEYCKHIDGFDYAFVLDADEVWGRKELLQVEQIIFARPDLRSVSFGMHEFWQDLAHKCRGIWENFLGRKTLVKLDRGLKYVDHLNPVDKDGKPFTGITLQDLKFFHYNYAKSDEAIRRKFMYYLNRGTPGFNLRKDWYETVWMGWKQAPGHVEKEYGTHPFGTGWTEPFVGEHPEAMHEHPKYMEFIEKSGQRALLSTGPKDATGYQNFHMERDDIINFPLAGIFEIVADDCLEHFGIRDIMPIMKAWYDRLRPNGRLTIITPDLRAVAESYVSGRFDYVTTLQFLYALQNRPVDVHRTLFDEFALKDMMERTGFREVRIEKFQSAFLRISGFK